MAAHATLLGRTRLWLCTTRAPGTISACRSGALGRLGRAAPTPPSRGMPACWRGSQGPPLFSASRRAACTCACTLARYKGRCNHCTAQLLHALLCVALAACMHRSSQPALAAGGHKRGACELLLSGALNSAAGSWAHGWQGCGLHRSGLAAPGRIMRLRHAWGGGWGGSDTGRGYAAGRAPPRPCRSTARGDRAQAGACGFGTACLIRSRLERAPCLGSLQ